MRDSLHVPGIRFKAVCDIWPYHQRYASRMLNRYGHPVNVYADYREMLADPGVEAVILTSPNHLHEEQAVAAAEAGKHVFCEKPLSLTGASAARIAAAAEAAGVTLGIGHERRFEPAMARLAAAGKRAIATVDSSEQLEPLEAAARKAGAVIPVCIDVDVSLRLAGGRIYLGVRRSPIRGPEDAVALARRIADSPRSAKRPSTSERTASPLRTRRQSP